MWIAWVLLLWQADYCGQTVRSVWSLVWLVFRSCLVWSLPEQVDDAGHKVVGCGILRGFGASADSLVGRVRFSGG